MRSLITITSFILLAQAQPDPARPIVPMKDYSKNSRVLDCQQCFDAGGQMCVNKDYSSMFSITKSSDTANGVCCKPDTDCSTGVEQLACSMKSVGDTSGAFKDVLSANSFNHQMFSYCPMDTQTKCGVTKKTASGLPDTNIYAMKDKQTISSSEIKYKKGDSSVRRNDFCYYVIKMTTDEEEKKKVGSDQYIEIMVNTNTNMNVYIYEGMSKEEAKKSVVSGNAQAKKGTTYRVKQDSGLLIISYPDLDKDASIDFQYWIGDTSVKSLDMEEDDDEGLTMWIGIAAAVAVLLIIVIIVVILCKSRKNSVEVQKNQQYDKAGQNTENELERKHTDQSALDFEQGSANKDSGLKPGKLNDQSKPNSPDTK